jgi:hypothetical protein
MAGIWMNGTLCNWNHGYCCSSSNSIFKADWNCAPLIMYSSAYLSNSLCSSIIVPFILMGGFVPVMVIPHDFRIFSDGWLNHQVDRGQKHPKTLKTCGFPIKAPVHPSIDILWHIYLSNMIVLIPRVSIGIHWSIGILGWLSGWIWTSKNTPPSRTSRHLRRWLRQRHRAMPGNAVPGEGWGNRGKLWWNVPFV